MTVISAFDVGELVDVTRKEEPQLVERLLFGWWSNTW